MQSQESMWAETFAEFVKRREFQRMTPQARTFIRDLRRGFAAAAAQVRDRAQGNRLKNTQVLQSAVCTVLRRRGIKVDQPTASVEVAMLQKRADISFRHRGKLWVIEIKFGLEFNSLGAAALEALAFRRKERTARFILLAMYAKFRDTDAAPVDVAHAVVRDCDLGKVFHQVHVLSRRALHDDSSWFASCADLVDEFVTLLPASKRAVSIAPPDMAV